MNTPRSHGHRRTLLLIAGASAGTALAGSAWGLRAQTPPDATAAASPASTPTMAASPEACETASPAPEQPPEAGVGETRVRFTAGDAEIVVRIADNPTSRDFVSMLPLTLEFEEFAGREKISYLPRELTTEGSTGSAPANGDLIYYVPWGNLGFFYNSDETYSDQVIMIGTIETGYDLLNDLETEPVSVELIPC